MKGNIIKQLGINPAKVKGLSTPQDGKESAVDFLIQYDEWPSIKLMEFIELKLLEKDLWEGDDESIKKGLARINQLNGIMLNEAKTLEQFENKKRDIIKNKIENKALNDFLKKLFESDPEYQSLTKDIEEVNNLLSPFDAESYDLNHPNEKWKALFLKKVILSQRLKTLYDNFFEKYGGSIIVSRSDIDGRSSIQFISQLLNVALPDLLSSIKVTDETDETSKIIKKLMPNFEKTKISTHHIFSEILKLEQDHYKDTYNFLYGNSWSKGIHRFSGYVLSKWDTIDEIIIKLKSMLNTPNVPKILIAETTEGIQQGDIARKVILNLLKRQDTSLTQLVSVLESIKKINKKIGQNGKILISDRLKEFSAEINNITAKTTKTSDLKEFETLYKKFQNMLTDYNHSEASLQKFVRVKSRRGSIEERKEKESSLETLHIKNAVSTFEERITQIFDKIEHAASKITEITSIEQCRAFQEDLNLAIGKFSILKKINSNSSSANKKSFEALSLKVLEAQNLVKVRANDLLNKEKESPSVASEVKPKLPEKLAPLVFRSRQIKSEPALQNKKMPNLKQKPPNSKMADPLKPEIKSSKLSKIEKPLITKRIHRKSPVEQSSYPMQPKMPLPKIAKPKTVAHKSIEHQNFIQYKKLSENSLHTKYHRAKKTHDLQSPYKHIHSIEELSPNKTEVKVFNPNKEKHAVDVLSRDYINDSVEITLSEKSGDPAITIMLEMNKDFRPLEIDAEGDLDTIKNILKKAKEIGWRVSEDIKLHPSYQKQLPPEFNEFFHPRGPKRRHAPSGRPRHSS